MLNLAGSSPVHSKLTILSTRNIARARTRRSTTGIITDQLDGRTNKTQHLRHKRLGLPTDRKITKILIDKIRKIIHLASSAQKCTIQLQRCTRCPTQLGKWVGGGPVKDEQRSFSLPCLRQVPHFYDTDSFLFSYRISNFSYRRSWK